MSAYLLLSLKAMLDEFTRIAWVLPLLTALELLLPASRCSWTSRLRGAVFWLLWIPVAALTITAFWVGWRLLGVGPLFRLDLRGSHDLHPVAVAGVAIGGFLFAQIVGDFFFYWYHRAQHAWFWRFHRVHHAIREMSAINCVQHIADEGIRVALMVLPLALLFDFQTRYVAWFAVLTQAQGQFIHAATRLHLGPLRYVLNDNRFHRIHHSLEPRHWHKNFGGWTTLWDQVFRTAYFPQRGEWPDTGLRDFEDPESVTAFLLAPLRPNTSP